MVREKINVIIKKLKVEIFDEETVADVENDLNEYFQEIVSDGDLDDLIFILYDYDYRLLIKPGMRLILSDQKLGWIEFERLLYWRYTVIKHLGKNILTTNYWPQTLGLGIIFNNIKIIKEACLSIEGILGEEPDFFDDIHHLFFLLFIVDKMNQNLNHFQKHYKSKLGIYEEVLFEKKSNSDPDKIIDLMCDYHLTQTFLNEKLACPEFESLDLLPYEIEIYIRYFIKNQSMHDFNHPLLRMGIPAFPKTSVGYNPSKDKILKKVVSKMSRK